ncbi:MAG: hypothetical protein Q8Q11_01950 [bacterium]|nr:hypothetical protein [bacterium]
MKELTPERFLTDDTRAREACQDSLTCQFVDSGTLGSIELRGLVRQLERNSIYAASFAQNPAEWAMHAQAYFDKDERQLGGHPHDIVVLENTRRILARTVRADSRHLGFVVRSDYNPAAIYRDPDADR